MKLWRMGQVPHDIGNTATNVAYPITIKLPEKLRAKPKRKSLKHAKKLPHKKALKLERELYNKNKAKGEKW
jgi:hypothetical protein